MKLNCPKHPYGSMNQTIQLTNVKVTVFPQNAQAGNACVPPYTQQWTYDAAGACANPAPQ
jgi:hypothetical protein